VGRPLAAGPRTLRRWRVDVSTLATRTGPPVARGKKATLSPVWASATGSLGRYRDTVARQLPGIPLTIGDSRPHVRGRIREYLPLP